MEANVLEIVEFTDPVCTWCWGSEPVLRTLETRFGNQVKISFVMGGLVKDITTFFDSFNAIGGDPERSNQNIAKHWLQASERHGMPVKAEGFNLFSNKRVSSYPQNIAYKAAQMQDEELAKRFLRRLREASAAEAKITSSPEVLAELASETGLDVAEFLNDFKNGNAKKAFEEDLYITSQYRVNGFPSFLIKYGENSMLLRGYQNYNNFKSVINHLSKDEIKEMKVTASEERILEFVKKYLSAAPIEVQTAFNLSDTEFEAVKDSLVDKQLVAVREAGNGYFLTPKVNPMACDISAGVCSQ